MSIQEDRGYEGLQAYKKSYALAIQVYSGTKNMPKEEMFGLTSQLRRAASSIPANIAEGYGKRESMQEYKRFLLMARGSCNETKVWINMCADLGYMPRQWQGTMLEAYEEVSKLVYGLIKSTDRPRSLTPES